LRADPENKEIIAAHRKWIPKENRKPAPGNRSRILMYENGKANWEGKDIAPNAPIPEVEDKANRDVVARSGKSFY